MVNVSTLASFLSVPSFKQSFAGLSPLSSVSFSQSADGLVFVSALLISQAILFAYIFHKMWRKSAEYEARMLADADYFADGSSGLPISQYPAVVSFHDHSSERRIERAKQIHLENLPVTIKSSDD